MASRFENRIVLVTGASRGIGAATAKAFALEGATVIANCLHNVNSTEQLAEEVLTERGKGTGSLLPLAADIRESSQVASMVREVLSKHGRIDILVNNAGVTQDTLLPIMEDSEWEDVMACNLSGTFKVTRAVSKAMMMARRGRIINLSSVAATKGGRGQSNYAASKAAIEGFTRALAVELAPRNIAVNAVAPGVIITDMTAFIREQGKEEALSTILMNRFGLPHEVADTILFLASEEASYITGAVIPVDGGFKMG